LPAAAVNSPTEVNQADSDAQQASQQPESTCLQDLMGWLVNNGEDVAPYTCTHFCRVGVTAGLCYAWQCLNWCIIHRGI
jgi:hypothetical protein